MKFSGIAFPMMAYGYEGTRAFAISMICYREDFLDTKGQNIKAP